MLHQLKNLIRAEERRLKELQKEGNIGALIIRIGFGAQYTIIVIRNPPPKKKKKIVLVMTRPLQ